MYLCVLYCSQNKQRLLTYTAANGSWKKAVEQAKTLGCSAYKKKGRGYSTSTCRFDIEAYIWLCVCNSEDIMFFTLNRYVTGNKKEKWGPVNVISFRDDFHLYCDQRFPRKGSLRIWNITIVSAVRKQKSLKILRNILSENNTRNILWLLVKYTETEYYCHSDILKIPVLTRFRSSLRSLLCKGVFSFSVLVEYFSVTWKSGLLFKYKDLSVAVVPHSE